MSLGSCICASHYCHSYLLPLWLSDPCSTIITYIQVFQIFSCVLLLDYLCLNLLSSKTLELG